MTATIAPARVRAPARPRPRQRRRRPDPSRLLSHVVLASYCLTSAASFVWFLMASVKSNREFLTESPWKLPGEVHLSNYSDAWAGSGLGKMVFNSFYVTVVSVGTAMVLATMAAYVLARVRFRGRETLAGLLLVGMLLPPFAAMIPLYFLLQDLHLLGSVNGLVLVYIANQIPLSVFVLRGFYADLPVELEEAAYLDGASAFRTFWQVVLPQTYPVMMSLIVLNALTIW
ncbi:MAG: carbohydrate ABC transporter permease, partial [Gemmatimonadales bacterium]